MKGAIIVLVAALPGGCLTGTAAKAPGAATSAAAPRPPLLVALENHEGWPSGAPIYRLEIDTDGAVRFEPRRYICVEGPETYRLPPEKIAELRAAIARSGFATTPVNCCSCMSSDTSDVTVTIADPPPAKTILDSGDCKDGPTTVRDLAQAVKKIIGIERWIGTPEDCRGPPVIED